MAPSELTDAVVARTARAVAAARHAEEATAAVLAAVRSAVGAGGAALLRADGDRLVPVAADGLAVSEQPMAETSLTPADGGGYPLVIGGRVEGVLLVSGVDQAVLAAREPALVALLDLAAVVLRNARLTEEQERRRQDREIRSLERISERPPDPAASLRSAHPDRFVALTDRYGELLDLALQRRAYVVDHDISGGLRSLAERFGRLGAGPRDVVDVHTTALRTLTADAPSPKARAYLDEGRVMALELMGYLAAYYRAAALRPGP